MRIPVQSENDAFRWVFGVTCVLLAGVVVGALAEPLYGVVLVAGAVLGFAGWEFLSRDPTAGSPLRGLTVDHPDGDRRRVLIVANETVTGGELLAEIGDRLERSAEVRVICPILPSRAHYIASDIDHELAEARQRLDRTLRWAADHDILARGHVSPEPPLEAVADELRIFPADEVIVSTHPPQRSKWLESGLVEQLQEDLDIPVRHIVVDLAAQPEEAPIR